MRIGFLFNHDAAHQVAHTAPVAAELAALDASVSVSILTSSEGQEERALALVPEALWPRIQVKRLEQPAIPFARLVDAVSPLGRIGRLRANLGLLGGFDALVVPETTSALLRTRFGLKDTRLIYLPHGAGDRSVGFRKVTSVFDLVLLSGPKVRDRMLADGIIRPQAHAIVGYPKFDTVDLEARPRFFDNGKPVVLYNPHFDPLLSSWYDMGPKVLNWFAGQDRYNLIFAPHVMLFRRKVHASVEHLRVRRRRDIPARLHDHPGILIDTGSRRSVDMSYILGAGIYLGDASSQIYEWLARPRPAIFLDSHEARWRGNPDYAHWNLGQVIGSVDELPAALERAEPNTFAEAQSHAFAETFSLTEEPSARRAARAILGFMARGTTRGAD